jgi:peroxiredoxin
MAKSLGSRRTLAIEFLLGIALALPGVSGFAALPVGATAPDFSAPAALGGRQFNFSLVESLRKGPVVLYFYPKAFTSGCTAEAHAFAEATPQFESLGATVVGMSVDDIAILQKFSIEACRDKFAVAADTGGRVTTQYDAAYADKSPMAQRISYVISPQGKVLYVFSSADPDEHVKRTMAAVEKWKSSKTQ